MKKSLKTMIAGIAILPALALGVVVAVAPQVANAADYNLGSGVNDANPNGGGSSVPTTLFGVGGIFTTIVNILLYIIGAVSVIMLIIGGVRYVVSGGDSGAVTSAKNTILYAIVGIVVAILAYALVNFVITSFSANQ
jgi:hypothetical protein